MKRAGHTLANKMPDSHLSHEPPTESLGLDQNKGVKVSFDRGLMSQVPAASFN